jgi:DNA-binding GntR family transcriptional regulator
VSTTSIGVASDVSSARLRRELAYTHIRRMVLLGQFQYGRRLAEEAIAATLDISRTPVREALARLHADRLLKRYDDGGYYVAELDLLDLRDLYELRLTLELRGISRAIEPGYKHDLSVVEPLRDSWRAIQLATPEPDGSFIELDEHFHLELSRAAGNRAITETLESVNVRIRAVRMYDFLSVDRIAVSTNEHLDILEAVLGSDLELAAARLRDHIGASMEIVEERAARAMIQMAKNRRR